jgi:signal transduction histidine kinase/CheY-like chemotaxis protein
MNRVFATILVWLAPPAAAMAVAGQARLSVAEWKLLCQEAKAPTTGLLRGSVTLRQGVLAGAPTEFYFQDDSGGVLARTPKSLGLREGDVVEATGGCTMEGGIEPRFEVRHLHKELEGKPVEPRAVTVEEAASGRYNGQLVRVRSEVHSLAVGEERDVVTLGDAKVWLLAYIRRESTQPSALAQAGRPDSLVEATGILIPFEDGCRLRLRRAGDVQVLRSPSIWTIRRVLLLSAIGGLVTLAVILWNVTLRRAIRRQTHKIQALLEEAQEASRLKSEFLANVSHEIRTPIHGILALQAMLLDSTLGPEQKEQIRTAHEATRALRSLLDDLLDVGRIEAGRMALQQEPFSPAALTRDCCAQFGAAALEKGLAFHTRIAPDLPALVVADAHRLRQVLLNLLSNAVKFTHDGSITVEATAKTTGERRTELMFSVRDTGIGIRQEDQAVIFETFRQADGSITRRYGGSGLGLAIVSQLVTLWGGSITVKSEVGVGSEFRFSLPAPIGSGAAEPERDAGQREARIRPLKILLAEDNSVNQFVARRMLEKDGHQVRIASTGREAVACYRQGEYDLVLMDLQMPDQDGREATREIREWERRGARRVPIIAMTAHALKEEEARCRAAGMDDFLSKPFEHEDLRAILARWASRSQCGAAQAAV